MDLILNMIVWGTWSYLLIYNALVHFVTHKLKKMFKIKSKGHKLITSSKHVIQNRGGYHRESRNYQNGYRKLEILWEQNHMVKSND